MEPQDLLDFQRDFSKESKMNGAAAGAALLAINRRYPDLKATDPDAYALFCGQRAIFENAHLSEIVANGTIFGNPVNSMQTLAYYQSGFDAYLQTGQGVTE